MAKKGTVHPWQQIEEQAFYAFREWPLWLVLRGRELRQQIEGTSRGAKSAEKGRTTSTESRRN